jgi:GNAT superfamily N-acetyltransferase
VSAKTVNGDQAILSPVFVSVALAGRIEGAEVRLTESIVRTLADKAPELGAFTVALGGGVAAFAGAASPMSKMIGLGFAGVPPAEELAAVEARFRGQRAALQAEVATLADPSVAAELYRRGYVLRNFENVSGRPLAPAREAESRGDVEIDLAVDMETSEWIETAITAFLHPDVEGVPADELPPREVLESALRPWAETPGFRRYRARVGGELAGVATLRLDATGAIAQLCGAATLPAFRRRGVQSALLERRLGDAARAGCELAVVTTQPGSKSQENVQRKGFSLLYARAILVKEAEP